MTNGRQRIGSALLLAAVALGSGGCRRPAEPPPLVLISIDTLRSDRLPAYGYSGGETPAIDRLARDGILFEQAFAPVPLTLPSHVSLLTGELPPRHGVRDNVGFTLERTSTPTLAERLGRLGYETGGAVSTFVLRGTTGIARGFDRWDAPEAAERPATETLGRLRPWLQDWRDRRFFLFFHLYEPHTPYRPPPGLAARFGDPYDGEIAAADRAVGELLADLDRLGIYERALIVLLSDHGEGLGDHGEEEHGFLLYREAIQIPLVVKLPGGARAGERLTGTVGLVDVLPTLLSAAGGEPVAELPGRSLLAPPDPDRPPVYSETWSTFIHFGWSELLSAVQGRYHFIDAPEPELYDLEADPGESRNLLDSERRAATALRAFLAEFPRELAPPREESDPETLAKLGALGYLGGGATEAPAGPRPNPRDELPSVAPILRGMRLYHEGSLEAAVATLRPAVEARPDALLGWRYLGRALAALGRRDEAREALAHALRGSERESFLTTSAALRMIDLGRPEAALEMLRQALARGGDSADLRLVESRALLVLGRLAEARAAGEAAVAADPALADARYQLAVVELTAGDAERGATELEAALAREPRHLPALKALAVVRYRLGNPEAARALLERAADIAPEDPDVRDGLERLRRDEAASGAPR